MSGNLSNVPYDFPIDSDEPEQERIERLELKRLQQELGLVLRRQK